MNKEDLVKEVSRKLRDQYVKHVWNEELHSVNAQWECNPNKKYLKNTYKEIVLHNKKDEL